MTSYISFACAFALVFSILVVLRAILSFVKVLVEKTGKFSLSVKEQITLALSISYIITYHMLP